MRPHALRVSAFGPFAGVVELDLDGLADAGLFLLHGQTGAGKTTLLDAMGFALFGRVPGARNDAKRLRSDHADPVTRTEVQLEVSFGDRRVRITRNPEYLRPKSRGTGTTPEKAAVRLEELLGGEWELRSTSAQEVGDEVLDLVGMSAEQFFQVVLLPQGEFAKFLRADSKDRAQVLQRLFATERFADAEGWLAQRRRTTAEALAAAGDRRDLVLARLAEATGTDLSESELLESEVLAWAAERHADALTQEAAAQAKVAEGEELRDRARAALDAATALQGLQQRRRGALDEQAQLEGERPLLLVLQAEADAAARAAEVVGALREVMERRATRDTALVHVDSSQGALIAAGLDRDLAAAELADVLTAARTRIGRLEALVEVDEARARDLAAADHARAEQAEALTGVADLEVTLAALPLRREHAATRAQAGRRAAEELPAVRAERDQLAALRPDVVQLVATETRLLELAEAHLSAREVHVALAQKANDLRTASINTMVARLAFALAEGTPCAVCGSLEHPDPSLLADEGVSIEDEDAARRQAEDAFVAVGEVEASLAATRARSLALRERVGAWTPAGVDAELAELDHRIAVLLAAVLDGERADEDVRDLAQLLTDGTAAHVSLTAGADSAGRRADELLARAAAAKQRLSDALDGAATLADALRQATDRVAAAEGARDAVQGLAAAKDELVRAQAGASEACAARGFADTDEALAATRDAAWRETTAARLLDDAAARARVAAALADPVLDVPLDPPAPVESRTADLATVDEDLARRTAQRATTRVRRSALDRLVPELANVLQELEPLQLKASQARRLADLCAGQGANGLKMTLSAFVLAARLEEVAAAASVRLRRMTQGRYELVHTDAGRGNKTVGLGLLARDSWTGQDRDTATLSGGETFLASLALALGLADVVTAEAGGTRIEALFVDEGFGTLDEETLDEVMDVLDGLREGGRLVGLVSHVAELRQRIPAQVEVRKTRAGSTVVVHGC